MSHIKCKVCDFEKKAKSEFLIKIIGAGIAIFGCWSWISYTFAGSGAAFIIAASIVGIGILTLIFSSQIQVWNSTKEDCPKCGKKEWDFFKKR